MCVDVFSDVMEAVVSPLHEKMDDWKKTAAALDKEHAKGICSWIIICISSWRNVAK